MRNWPGTNMQRRLSPLLALACALGGAALIYGAVYTVAGQSIDATTRHLMSTTRSYLAGTDTVVLSLVSSTSIGLVMGAAALIALVRRRWALAGRVIVLVAGANLTTQLVKHYLVTRPNLGIDYGTINSNPSGHTTAALAAAVGLALVVPHSWRTLATWTGSIFATLMGVSVMVNSWHRLSDVLAAVLVVGFWTLLLCPVEKRRGQGRLSRRFQNLLATLALAATALGCLAGAFLIQRVDLMPVAWQQSQELMLGSEMQGFVASGIVMSVGLTLGFNAGLMWYLDRAAR